MTYKEAMDFIEETKKMGSLMGLDTIRELMNRLCNPQDKLQIVHVAGTNGKGSTIAFLSAILSAEAYRVGRYVSPSVFSYGEKIQILTDDNRTIDNISRENVCKALELIKEKCEEMLRDGYPHPTSFEVETAMVFLYMYWQEVDFLILETGMGGRLDATNIINHPISCVITSVSMDHMDYLGDKLEEIAREKAGIMKANAPLITCKQDPQVMRVLNKKTKELDIALILADLSKAHLYNYHMNYTEFAYPNDNTYRKYKINLLGKYQIVNAIIAIETARQLNARGYLVSEEAIEKGLGLAVWPGRFEKISSSPDIYIDGAHNEEAALSLRDSIEIYFKNRKLIFMIGVLAHKDYQSILRILAPLAELIVTVTPDNERALASDLLAKEARVYCDKVYEAGDIDNALELVSNKAQSDHVIIAFGSLSFLGELKKSVDP